MIEKIENEAVGNIDRLAEWLKKCRDATPEERESVDNYIESISTPTGVTFDRDKTELKSELAELDRAVSLNAVIKALDTCFDAEYAKAVIKQLPSVSQEKTGHWLPIIDANENGEPYQSGVYCDNCGFRSVSEDNFCPNCGADMREDGEK